MQDCTKNNLLSIFAQGLMIGVNNFLKRWFKAKRDCKKYFHDRHPRIIVPGDDDPFHFLSICHQPDAILSESIPLLLHLRSSVVFLKYDLSRKENWESRENLIIWLCHFSQQLWPCSEKFYFTFFSVRFVHFWKFLSVFLECESNGRKNTIQLIYDCRWRGQQSAKNRQTEQRKLRTDFFGVIWAFHAHAMGECPRIWRRTEGKVFYGTNWL